jgi:hypothetical protein
VTLVSRVGLVVVASLVVDGVCAVRFRGSYRSGVFVAEPETGSQRADAQRCGCWSGLIGRFGAQAAVTSSSRVSGSACWYLMR